MTVDPSLLRPAVRYFDGMNAVGQLILQVSTNPITIWYGLTAAISRIDIRHPKKNAEIIAEIKDLVNNLNELTNDSISMIKTEMDKCFQNARLISRTKSDIKYILKVAKFIYGAKAAIDVPVYDVENVMTICDCTKKEAQYGIDVMTECGVHCQCPCYDLLKTINEYARMNQISIYKGGLNHFITLDQVDPSVYEFLMK